MYRIRNFSQNREEGNFICRKPNETHHINISLKFVDLKENHN